MKKILFLCLTALPLAAFSADGMPQDLKHFFAGLTAAERDNFGEMVANEMRQKNKDNQYSDSGLRFVDVRYRSSDDTFVMMAAESPDQDSVADSMQSMLEQEFARMMRGKMCSDTEMRDLMTIGRYAVEYRITTANGKKFRPVRIGAKDCR